MTLLLLDGVVGGYGRIEVLRGVSLRVDEGEIVALLGANGAGKTTTVRTISGLLPTWRGTISFDGHTFGRSSAPERRAALGLGHLPEGRGIFQTLTVRENLDLGACMRRDGGAVRADRDRLLGLFDALSAKLNQPASSLSGGQQQMLAVARAMMARPKLLMIDELSFGLAPVLVDQLFSMVRELRDTGTTFLLVEQHAGALEIADRAYVFKVGRNDVDGDAAALRESGNLVRSYLG